jgi:hypothetical protein
MELLKRRTQPQRERVRLRVGVFAHGALVDRERVLDVSVRRDKASVAVRVRFREPATLRGVAVLSLEELVDGKRTRRAWRYDPQRRRVSRIAVPSQDERLGGTGLTWEGLRGEEPHRWRYTLVGEARLELKGDPAKGRKPVARTVLHILARPRADGAVRRLYLDREHKTPLLSESLDSKGRVVRRVRFWRYRRQGEAAGVRIWRAFSLSIHLPQSKRLSEVKLVERWGAVPSYHFDPDRFGNE